MSTNTKWIWDEWGIFPGPNGRWFVVFGEQLEAVCGCYPSRRRAKKEITHYIKKGLSKGPFRGAYRYLDHQKAA